MERVEEVTTADAPELFFGLVGAIGTDLGLVERQLRSYLSQCHYTAYDVHLSDRLRDLEPYVSIPESPVDIRIGKLMDAGNDLRQRTGQGDALVALGIQHIRLQFRGGRHERANEEKPRPKTAYIFRSLKNKQEVETLREVYGNHFHLIACYTPRAKRIDNLADRIARSYKELPIEKHREAAEGLNKRDEDEEKEDFGQEVRDVYPLADVFVDVSRPESIAGLDRFIQLLFGNFNITPNKHEYAMFHARAAALRSGALSRQVGAVVFRDGDVIAVGTNEVPKAGGGLYWPEDVPDHRDLKIGFDSADKARREILQEILTDLKKGGWLANDKARLSDAELLDESLRTPLPGLKNARVMDLNEFGRTVHAEMAALIDAAKRGISTRDATMYVTTFPCHECARHIVAAGISRVFYIEPYPKSHAFDLHKDSILIDHHGDTRGLVSFESFFGVAPRKYIDLFSIRKGERKTKQGHAVLWNHDIAKARCSDYHRAYMVREQDFLAQVIAKMDQSNIRFVNPPNPRTEARS